MPQRVKVSQPDVQAQLPSLRVSLSRVGVTEVEKIVRFRQGGVEQLFGEEGVAGGPAVLGASVGEDGGRRSGPALKAGRLGRMIGDQRWVRAEAYVSKRGGSAVFFGRWVGLLRALVPAVTGMVRMPSAISCCARCHSMGMAVSRGSGSRSAITPTSPTHGGTSRVA